MQSFVLFILSRFWKLIYDFFIDFFHEICTFFRAKIDTLIHKTLLITFEWIKNNLAKCVEHAQKFLHISRVAAAYQPDWIIYDSNLSPLVWSQWKSQKDQKKKETTNTTEKQANLLLSKFKRRLNKFTTINNNHFLFFIIIKSVKKCDSHFLCEWKIWENPKITPLTLVQYKKRRNVSVGFTIWNVWWWNGWFV